MVCPGWRQSRVRCSYQKGTVCWLWIVAAMRPSAELRVAFDACRAGKNKNEFLYFDFFGKSIHVLFVVIDLFYCHIVLVSYWNLCYVIYVKPFSKRHQQSTTSKTRTTTTTTSMRIRVSKSLWKKIFRHHKALHWFHRLHRFNNRYKNFVDVSNRNVYAVFWFEGCDDSSSRR